MLNAAPMFTEQRLREIDDEVIAAINSRAHRFVPLVVAPPDTEPSPPPPPPAAPARRAAAASAAPLLATTASPPLAAPAAPAAPAAAAPSARPQRFGSGMQLHGINHDGRGGSVVITKIASR